MYDCLMDSLTVIHVKWIASLLFIASLFCIHIINDWPNPTYFTESNRNVANCCQKYEIYKLRDLLDTVLFFTKCFLPNTIFTVN